MTFDSLFAGVVLQCMWLATFFFPIDAPDSESKSSDIVTTPNDVTKSSDVTHVLADTAGQTETMKISQTDNHTETTVSTTIKVPPHCCCSNVWSAINSFWNFTLLKNHPFLCYIFVVLMAEFTAGLFYRFTAIRARSDGIEAQNAAFLPSIMATASTCFRVIVAIVANLPAVSSTLNLTL